MVILDYDVQALVYEVQKSIKKGWKPIGGISMTYLPKPDYCLQFGQALVKL